jgi:hypothetical protein
MRADYSVPTRSTPRQRPKLKKWSDVDGLLRNPGPVLQQLHRRDAVVGIDLKTADGYAWDQPAAIVGISLFLGRQTSEE